MCFNIHPEHKEVKIAAHNIEVKKWYRWEHGHRDEGTKVFKSPYFNHEVKLGKNYYATMKIRPSSFVHRDKNHEGTVGIMVIDEGLHSYEWSNPVADRLRGISNEYSSSVVIKCIIPKGTPYYYNPELKEYVSECIKTIKILPEELSIKLIKRWRNIKRWVRYNILS